MSDNVRLQNLRDFTVQIRDAASDAIVGTGVVVSMEGRIVTCAHVVRAAGVEPRDGDGAEVGVYFPQARGSDVKARRATIVGCFAQHDDDVALLQLVGGPTPLGPEQIAVLGAADESEGHEFRSYGYRRLDSYIAGRADGTIMGPVEPPEGRAVQADPLQLQSGQINAGMSGAAVLDVARNLVVGIVSETWFPDLSTKDRDTAWAVDACVLAFDPLSLPLHDAPLPLRAAPQPKADVEVAQAAADPNPGVVLHGAPPPLPKWTGRAELLRELGADWADGVRRVTGLIGFGGEGKSSLIRRWLDDLLADPALPQPDGVFWWGFYDKPGVDEFFESALSFMGGGRIDPRDYPSASARAHLIAAMLATGHYLFVLDGLEVLQHQEGDQYGLLASNDLREFLQFFAAPVHRSFCLITSRTPLFDLQSYTTYTHRDVDRLSAADGRALLRRLGVKGADAALDKIVFDWDGHALTLSLLAAYLTDRHAGDAAYIGDIPAPTADEPRYQRVHRVLRRYDEHLSTAERAFLTLFSAFRMPVREDAFGPVFRTKTSTRALNAPIAELDDAAFDAILKRLVVYRILRYDPRKHHYTTHPLIRAHYYAILSGGSSIHSRQSALYGGSSVSASAAPETADTEEPPYRSIHAQIKDYYLTIAGDTPHFPTLDDLAPLIEVVYHACRAGAYDEACQFFRERIYEGNRRVIIYQLGAYDITLALMLEFFPGRGTSQEPQASDPHNRSFILNEVGFCLMSLGRLGEAAHLYERKNAIALSMEDWHDASRGYERLADLHAFLGALDASADAAREELARAHRAGNQGDERNSLVRQAWVDHLRGDLEAASAAFRQAEVLVQESGSNKHYLYGLRGIRYADHLRRISNATYARRITEANLAKCEQNHWRDNLSRSHRVLADLDADACQQDSARQHYDEALKIARGISYRPALIEALLARGRWAARRGNAAAARGDLDEALDYAIVSGYRIYEADIRIGLAWAHHAAGDPAMARAEAARARQMSAEMGYYWGQVDADEVLAAIDAATSDASSTV
jgi:tetratricopeptide (TPR) repeat protein